MRQPITYSYSLLALCCTTAFASAAPELIHVTSEQMMINANNHTATYINNVKAHQGLRTLTANTLVIDQGKSSSIQQMTAYGTPATSSYEASAQNHATSIGQAKRIIYIPDQHLIRYLDDAKLEQNGNIFKGQIINYNTLTETANSPSSLRHPTVINIPAYDSQKNTPTTSTKPR